MRLILVTHAETDWTEQRRYQGHTDVPLNSRGRQQAQWLLHRLARVQFDAIVTSDLRRAWETAEIIAAKHALSAVIHPRLREMHFGDWEGLTYAEIEQRFPVGLRAWHKDPRRQGPPNGESLSAVEDRLADFLNELRAYPPEATVGIVGHRGSLRVLLCLLLGLPGERNWEKHLDVASVTEVITIDRTARIVRLNETMAGACQAVALPGTAAECPTQESCDGG